MKQVATAFNKTQLEHEALHELLIAKIGEPFRSKTQVFVFGVVPLSQAGLKVADDVSEEDKAKIIVEFKSICGGASPEKVVIEKLERENKDLAARLEKLEAK